jgi:hypothetical protein
MVTPSTHAWQIKPNWGRSCAHNCGDISMRQQHCGGSVAPPREGEGKLATWGTQPSQRGQGRVSVQGGEGIPRL